MTARWVVDGVQPERDIKVTWQPISLYFKNEPDEGNPRFAWYERSHNLLRVMESIRAEEGNKAVQDFYWELGRKIHHDKNFMDFVLADVLNTIGVSSNYVSAYDNPDFDEEIRKRMARGIELAGEDIGTPIIAFDDPQGQRVGIFGPVITRVPEGNESVKLWDSVVTLTTTPGFWELKRTRTEKPEFGGRP
ncbi:MAG: hypothetical protein CL455_06045 [Acidimicrobiaceae bacterium]|nr:hypothetical protein [Acidimicrobiaceae bacterium]MEC7844803.1 hypothetical protein [Actinomycetota bacterium]